MDRLTYRNSYARVNKVDTELLLTNIFWKTKELLGHNILTYLVREKDNLVFVSYFSTIAGAYCIPYLLIYE